MPEIKLLMHKFHVFKQSLSLQIFPLFDKAESKNKLLRSVAGGGVDQIGTLQARWDKFELMMESHELMVKEQVGCHNYCYTGYLTLWCLCWW